VLSRDLQPRIAKNLGYENDETSLGVERFMRDYYCTRARSTAFRAG
jgi:UTP:GlnB (protein PII) uridylyltransferase